MIPPHNPMLAAIPPRPPKWACNETLRRFCADAYRRGQLMQSLSATTMIMLLDLPRDGQNGPFAALLAGINAEWEHERALVLCSDLIRIVLARTGAKDDGEQYRILRQHFSVEELEREARRTP